MSNKLISVIIPTHAGSANISRAVDSVLAQSYQNVEVIVIDDNGLNSENQILTAKKMETYISNDKVKYIVHPINSNGSAARNTGIKISKGEYIAFLDDDDFYFSNCIQKEIEQFEKLPENYGIIFTSFKQIREGFKEQNIIQEFDGTILFEFLNGEIESPSSVIMIRRDIINRIGMWDESFWRHQDWEYITRILFEYKAYSMKDVLVQRNVYGRHVPNNPIELEKLRLHFLNSMSKIIQSLPVAQQKEIYNRHYFDIGKSYFKAKKYGRSINYALRTTNPFKNTFKYLLHGFIYLKKRYIFIE